MEPRNFFMIPECNLAQFNDQIAKLSKRAQRLIGEEITATPFGSKDVEVNGETVRYYRVHVNSVEVRARGYNFLGTLDHTNETGVIVRKLPDVNIDFPVEFRQSNTCDHCNTKRIRRNTFVLQNSVSGELIRVGSSCLTDFFGGHNPIREARYAELLGYVREVAESATDIDAYGREGQRLNDYRWIDVERFCATVSSVIRHNGWVSGGKAYDTGMTSTKTHAMRWDNDKVTDEDRANAREALDWAAGLKAKGDEMSDWENNISVISEAVVCEPKSLGLVASIVGVFMANKSREAARKVTPVGQAVTNFDAIVGLLNNAKSKLRFPKLRLLLDNGQIVVLSLAGDRSQYKGSINLNGEGQWESRAWFGRIEQDGRWVPGRDAAPISTSLLAIMTAMSNDPVGTATAFGRKTGNCCFCNKGLDDERSVAVGYGATCAKNWGLPWGAKAAAAVAMA